MHNMSNGDSQMQILVNMKTDMVTIELKTTYGPIIFSYSPSAIKAGIAMLVEDILKPSKEGESLLQDMERLGLSTDLVTDAAILYKDRVNQIFPLDAIEQFSPNAEAYSRGIVEQFSDNLVPTLILMLDYLSSITLVVGGTDSDPHWQQKVTNEHKATVEMLRERLGASIQRLLNRQHYENDRY